MEEDLEGYGVVILAPPDGYSTSSNVTTLRWEVVPHANAYRVQVAEPDFMNSVAYQYDSLITSNSFNAVLPPGSYRWRVRGENPNSYTSYYERALIVTEATTLDGLTPILTSPANNAALSADPLAFTWELLNGADDYRFELRAGGQTGNLITAQIVAAPPFMLTIINDGDYTWTVQGQNGSSTSAFSYRSLTVDRTAPGIPVLTNPATGATLPNAPFNFQWQSGMDASTIVVDSVFVLNSNAQVLRAIQATTNSLPDSLGVGTYTWYVRTIDAAGNGTSSAEIPFTIQ